MAVLLTSPGVPVADDRLIAELWGDDPPPAHHQLQVYVSGLRGSSASYRMGTATGWEASALVWYGEVLTTLGDPQAPPILPLRAPFSREPCRSFAAG
jgi:hypothetical protein